MKVQQLFEGISPILYHYTDFVSLRNILVKNKFNLTIDIGTQAEKDINKGSNKFYYLSTTRHKLGGFSLEPAYTGIMLKLDGRKLGHNLKGSAVDYWGEDFRKIRPEKFEAEDRIYSSKPHIDNAKKYIQEVHILYRTDKQIRPITTSKLRKSVIQLKTSKIPYFVYDNVRDFITQNKKKSTQNIGKTSSTVGDDKFGSRYNGYDYAGIESRYTVKDFNAYFELYNTPVEDVEKLSKDAERLRRDIVWYQADKIATFSNMIHNNKTKDSKYVHKLSRILRREKMTSSNEFIMMLSNKWNKVK